MVYKYYAKISQSIILFLTSLLLSAICAILLLMVISGDGEDISIMVTFAAGIGVIFFGFGVIVMGKRIIDRILRKPILILDQNGITDRTSAIVSSEPISWDKLSGFSYYEMNQGAGKQSFVGLLFKDPKEIERILSPTKLSLNRQSQQMFGGGDYMFVSISQIKAKPGHILQAIHDASGGTVKPLNVDL